MIEKAKIYEIRAMQIIKEQGEQEVTKDENIDMQSVSGSCICQISGNPGSLGNTALIFIFICFY